MEGDDTDGDQEEQEWDARTDERNHGPAAINAAATAQAYRRGLSSGDRGVVRLTD